MKRKSLIAIALLLVLVFVLAGCNYVSRPIGAGNHASDTSSQLSVLLKQPTKTVVQQTVQNITEILKEPEKQPSEPEPEPEPEPPVDETASSPFELTTDVFSKIEELLKQVSDKMVATTSATGVSDELMKGRTVYVYTPYDISGKDEAMMKSVANKLNMTVVVNNLNKTGAAYSAQMKKIALSGIKADLMFVDQNTWGDIQYYTQPITSFVNFEIGDKLGSFYSGMSANYSISNAFYKSEQTVFDQYVASGIGAPYLLAYNRDNLVTTGTLPQEVDASDNTYFEVNLQDPVKMYDSKTWGLKAMQQMLINSTKGKTVGLATVKDVTSNVNWWFGCDNVAGFKINVYSKSALPPSTDDYYSPAGMSRYTLDTIQELYWTSTGANKLNVAQFIDETEKDVAISKLMNSYIGTDSASKYAMLGIEGADLSTMFAKANGADWDFVAYPYGVATENQVRMLTPDEDGIYRIGVDGQDVLALPSAGWASGFAVLKRCATPAVALRFAEDYTLAWQEDYESSFADLLSEEQAERYKNMKKNMGVTFYTSMISHTAEMLTVHPEAAGKVNTLGSGLSASAEFISYPALFTQPILDKNTAVGTYNPAIMPKWSNFINTTRANGMAASYDYARVMFAY